jgi:hypothetical protein
VMRGSVVMEGALFKYLEWQISALIRLLRRSGLKV